MDININYINNNKYYLIQIIYFSILISIWFTCLYACYKLYNIIDKIKIDKLEITADVMSSLFPKKDSMLNFINEIKNHKITKEILKEFMKNDIDLSVKK